MGLNNIEKQIQEKLNSREIKPDTMAWDRLDSMLSAAEEKKSKRPFGWLYIAASIIVLATLGTVFINQKDTFINANNKGLVAGEIIKDDIKSNESSNKKQFNANQIKIKEKKAIVFVEPKVENKHQKSNQSFKSIHQKTTINPIINNNQKNALVNAELIAQSESSKIEAKNEIGVAKQNNVNADDLLASAQLNTKNKKATIKVNANTLLSQVDGELDQTFRQKVINQISKNYQEVKVALINRNQE